MSKFSGKCDFYDQIFMFSDHENEIDAFNEFKDKTGGVIHIQTPLIFRNKKEVLKEIERLNNPDKLKYDKDKKVFVYYGREFKSAAALNKVGYVYLRDVKFEDPIDLIQYYPYLISMSYCSNDSQYIVLSSESYPMMEYKENKYYTSRSLKWYNDELKAEFIRVVKTYY